MNINPASYQNSDTRQLATDLNTILASGSSGIKMSPHIVNLPDITSLTPLVYDIPTGTISFTVFNNSATKSLTLGVNVIAPGESFSFSASNGFFGAQTITIDALGSAQIAHTTPTPII